MEYSQSELDTLSNISRVKESVLKLDLPRELKSILLKQARDMKYRVMISSVERHINDDELYDEIDLNTQEKIPITMPKEEKLSFTDACRVLLGRLVPEGFSKVEDCGCGALSEMWQKQIKHKFKQRSYKATITYSQGKEQLEMIIEHYNDLNEEPEVSRVRVDTGAKLNTAISFFLDKLN